MNQIIVVLLIVAVLAMANGALALAPTINIVLTSQQPFPAEPGQNVEIEIEIQNNGLGEARDLSVEILPTAPFTLLPGEEEAKTFGLVEGRSSVKTTYLLHIDEDAVTNAYEIEFDVVFANGGSQTEEVSVSVQGEPRLILERASLQPANIEAGGTTDLIIDVINVGTGTARDLTLTLNSTDELIPLLSDSIAYLGDLLPDGEAHARMTLSVDNAAEQKTYIITLSASYQDEANTHQSETFEIGVPVSGTVQLDIIKTAVDHEREVVEIEVANKGTTDATSVEAQLFVNGELVDIDYISQIKPTKKITFTFPLIEEAQATLEIHYTGPGLERNTIEKEIVFDFENTNNSESLSSAVFLVVIILIIGGIFWHRRRKKKKLF